MEKSNWVISICGLTPTPTGHNLKNRLYALMDVTEEEATGKAIMAFLKESPESPIHLVVPMNLKLAEDKPVKADD